jgi:hypothetical protein
MPEHTHLNADFRILRSLSAARRAPRIAKAIDNIEDHLKFLETYIDVVLDENKRLRKALSHHETERKT